MASNNLFAMTDRTPEFEQEDIQNNKVMSILAYIGPLVLVTIFAAKDSKSARFNANQGLVLLILEAAGSTPFDGSVTLADLIRRPELSYAVLAPADPERPVLSKEITEQVEIELKYEGYLRRQEKQIRDFKRAESRKIPADLDYDEVPSLRLEARAKLAAVRPENMGQASRIAGVSPADTSVLMIYLEKRARERGQNIKDQ